MAPIRVCFLFNAQRHQLLHGISTAVELARRPGFDVHVVSPNAGHIAYARTLAERLGGAPITFTCPHSRLLAAACASSGRAVPPKLLTLTMLAPYLNRFDAICLPERTSIYLKKIGVRHPRFVHLDHGAGDRAAGFDPRIRRFDFVLMAGEKHRARMLREGLIREGACAVTGYPKFDAAAVAREPGWTPFDGTRPIVLYNPHFSPLGSWEKMGAAVLAAFAAQDRYDLIVAPHVRLLDGHRSGGRWAELLARYEGNPHIHIDRGSDRAIDMTHTMLADVYIGDVSSQVYEFLARPRPCLFLDPHGIDWQADENYAHWHFGPVATTSDGLVAQVDRAVATHDRWLAAQRDGFARTFGGQVTGGSALAAAAIGGWLEARRLAPPARRPARAEVRPARRRVLAMRRAAMIVPTLAAGWLLHEIAEIRPAQAASFVDEAITSHRTIQVRERMRSQSEITDYDPAEIARATGLVLPRLPAGWRVRDVQVFPAPQGMSAQLSLSGAGGERFSMIALRGDTPAGRQPLAESRSSEHVAYWEEGGMAYALVGEIPAARLLSLASALAGG